MVAPVECLGAFAAQYFKFLSGDPNSIFQFFAFPDRLIMVKVGSSINQVPAMLLSQGRSRTSIGVKDYTAGGLPSLDEAKALISKINEKKILGFKSPGIPSREISVRSVQRIESRKTYFHRNGTLRIHLTSGEKLPFIFAKPEQAAQAGKLLRTLFSDKYVAE